MLYSVALGHTFSPVYPGNPLRFVLGALYV